MNLTIPDNNDFELLDAACRLANKNSPHKIVEAYGKPTRNVVIGSGRANIFGNIEREKMIERVLAFRKLNIEYDYTINGILPRARELENRHEIIEELEWLESSPIGKVTVANYELARLVGRYAPNLEVVVSSFAAVNSIRRFEQWAGLSNVRTVITDRGTYRNLPFLEELAKRGKNKGVGIRVIANLGCMADCMRTEEHAIIKDLASIDRNSLHYAPCTFYCMKYLLENPEEFLRLPIIRPEDLSKYEDIGVDSVKLVDRVQTTLWIEGVVGHYLDGTYRGNILELTCNFTNSGIREVSNDQLAAIDIAEVMKSTDGVHAYRVMLPELMRISIDPDYDFLGFQNLYDNCRRGCHDHSAVKVDHYRRKIVLNQLKQLEEKYLYF